MVKKYIKYSLLIIVLIVLSVIGYWYYNPTIDNKDFDLEFRVSNETKNFYEERNKKIERRRFTYNDERYFNNVDKCELIIHSLDIIKGKERIIIVHNYLRKNNLKKANIIYKDETGRYSPLKIEHKNDSVFIIQQIGVENNLIFKGKRM
ncbi:hypothetical protein [uncultured Chryseobacterium sp.]|uniref:hypothetical protein n=1 Tax=uncultured Chryseobacterium sp. TaxID=259322 RepID=UPI0025E7D987|nr:hypothetical protein [uncultured Chryseobacterium sp.]